MKVNEGILKINGKLYLLEEYIDEDLCSNTTMSFFSKDSECAKFKNKTSIGVYLDYKNSNPDGVVELIFDPEEIDKYKMMDELAD